MTVRVCRHGVASTVKGHDCAYVGEREKLIPRAVREADRIAGARPFAGNVEAYAQYARTWNLAFHERMNTLWAESRRDAN